MSLSMIPQQSESCLWRLNCVKNTWKLDCITGHGQRPRERTGAARHQALLASIAGIGC